MSTSPTFVGNSAQRPDYRTEPSPLSRLDDKVSILPEDPVEALKYDSEPKDETTDSPSSPSNPRPAPVPQILLLGDSITEQAVIDIQAPLQCEYIRRADILNRGFSGFNSAIGLQALRKVLPACAPAASPTAKVILVTIWFGANDSTLPGEAQHVPVKEYTENLRQMVHHEVFKRDGTNFVLITPPPVNEFQFEKNPATGRPQRMANVTTRYAKAVRDVAKELNLPMLDMWSILLKKCGWKESDGTECCRGDHGEDEGSEEGWERVRCEWHLPGCGRGKEDNGLIEYLRDGLHFTPKAYAVLLEELLKAIRRDVPSCAPEKLHYVISDWKEALGVVGS